jgi:hypothetical protein
MMYFQLQLMSERHLSIPTIHGCSFMWNELLELQDFVFNWQKYGWLTPRNAWSHVWFALDNYYSEV